MNNETSSIQSPTGHENLACGGGGGGGGCGWRVDSVLSNFNTGPVGLDNLVMSEQIYHSCTSKQLFFNKHQHAGVCIFFNEISISTCDVHY